jgi:hypothetical protein
MDKSHGLPLFKFFTHWSHTARLEKIRQAYVLQPPAFFGARLNRDDLNGQQGLVKGPTEFRDGTRRQWDHTSPSHDHVAASQEQ